MQFKKKKCMALITSFALLFSLTVGTSADSGNQSAADSRLGNTAVNVAAPGVGDGRKCTCFCDFYGKGPGGKDRKLIDTVTFTANVVSNGTYSQVLEDAEVEFANIEGYEDIDDLTEIEWYLASKPDEQLNLEDVVDANLTQLDFVTYATPKTYDLNVEKVEGVQKVYVTDPSNEVEKVTVTYDDYYSASVPTIFDLVVNVNDSFFWTGYWKVNGEILEKDKTIVKTAENGSLIPVLALNEVDVKFMNGDEEIKAVENVKNTTAWSTILPEDPTPPEGYSFEGWYVASSDDVIDKEGFIDNSVAKDGVITVNAKFNPTEYSIAYVINGESKSFEGLPANYTVESETLSIDKVSVENFDGWYTSTNCLGPKFETFSIEKGTTGNITLYARSYSNSKYLELKEKVLGVLNADLNDSSFYNKALDVVSYYAGLSKSEKDTLKKEDSELSNCAETITDKVISFNRVDSKSGVTLELSENMKKDDYWYLGVNVEDYSADLLKDKVGNNIIWLYDISLVDYRTGKDYGLSDGQSATIKIPASAIDEGRYKNIKLFHEKSDGSIEWLEYENVDGYYTFEMTTFSPVGITGDVINDSEKLGGLSATGDNSPMLALMMVSLNAIIAAVYAFMLKKITYKI